MGATRWRVLNQISISVQGVTASADFVLFRVGTVAGLIEYADFAPDPDQLQSFVTEAVNKIEGKPTAAST
jgi:hypothetical protein